MSSRSEFQQTTRSAGLIGLMASGGAFVGFFLQLIVAYHFGASNNTDAYFMALSTSELLSKVLLGGSITAVFIPLFIERLTRGKKTEAWNTALNLLHLTSLLFIVLIILLATFAEFFIGFIAPGFDAETAALTVKLLRLLLPAFLFLFIVELSTSMLHALKQFAIPATLRIVAPLTSIIIILLFVKSIGIYSLALGTVLGSIIQLTVIFYGLYKQGFRYSFILKPLDPAIKRLFHLVYPFFLSVFVTQSAGIVYRILVSDLPSGSLASLKFAEKISQMITIIFLSSITMVIYPTLSEKAARRDYVGMRNTIASAIRLITLLTIPIIVGVAMLRIPLISLIYQRGSFTAHDAAMTSIALLFIIIGLTTNGISSVLGHTTLALQQTRAAVAVAISSHAIAIALFVLLVPVMAHAGLALASSLVPLSITLLYFLYLTRFIPNLIQIFIHQTYIKIFFLALALASTLYLTIPFTQTIEATHTISLLIQLIIPTLLGSLVFFGGALLWRIPEMHDLTSIAKSKLVKWTSR